MNRNISILSIFAVSLLVVSMIAPVSMSDAEETTADLASQINNATDDVEIVLESGKTYTMSSCGVSKNVTISTTGTDKAKIILKNGTNSTYTHLRGDYSNNVSVSNVYFVLSEDHPSGKAFKIEYFKEVSITDCDFTNVVTSAYGPNIATGHENDSCSIDVKNCSWSNDSLLDLNVFALTLKGFTYNDIESCSISNSTRGLNAEMVSNLAVHGCQFNNIPGKCALQVSCKDGDAQPNVTNNGFIDCKAAISIHEISTGGSLNSSSNRFINCESDFYYSEGNGMSDTTISSNNDAFLDSDGNVRDPVISSEEGSPIPSGSVEINDPYTSPEPVIPDDDDFVPPHIPQQSGGDTTMLIACCAAASVVALLAVLIVMMERKR